MTELELEKIREEMCDSYCQYSSKYYREKDTERLEEKCEACPMNKLHATANFIMPREKAVKQLVLSGISTEEELARIEKTLGFQLTPNQIFYLATGRWRMLGSTTAEAVKRFLLCRGGEVHFQKNGNGPVEWEQKEQEKIIRKLSSAGLGDVKIIFHASTERYRHD